MAECIGMRARCVAVCWCVGVCGKNCIFSRTKKQIDTEELRMAQQYTQSNLMPTRRVVSFPKDNTRNGRTIDFVLWFCVLFSDSAHRRTGPISGFSYFEHDLGRVHRCILGQNQFSSGSIEFLAARYAAFGHNSHAHFGTSACPQFADNFNFLAHWVTGEKFYGDVAKSSMRIVCGGFLMTFPLAEKQTGQEHCQINKATTTISKNLCITTVMGIV